MEMSVLYICYRVYLLQKSSNICNVIKENLANEILCKIQTLYKT